MDIHVVAYGYNDYDSDYETIVGGFHDKLEAEAVQLQYRELFEKNPNALVDYPAVTAKEVGVWVYSIPMEQAPLPVVMHLMLAAKDTEFITDRDFSKGPIPVIFTSDGGLPFGRFAMHYPSQSEVLAAMSTGKVVPYTVEVYFITRDRKGAGVTSSRTVQMFVGVDKDAVRAAANTK